MTDAEISLENLAPICLFAFNRPEHTRQTLAALAESPLAAHSDLIVYLDGPRTEAEGALVDAVAQVVEAQEGFASVSLNRREANAGLARSIQDGVSAVMQSRGKAIVVEDDIVTSPAFLSYMNLALDRYEADRRVWHIAGYNEDLAPLQDRPGPMFWRFMSCWGWASWADRWQHFERDPEKLVSEFSAEDIHRLNLDGAEDFWSQVLGNLRGEIRTWAIFWYVTIFRNGGLCLSPCQSYAQNIGFDGSGTHCGTSEPSAERVLNLDFNPLLPDDVAEDRAALEALRRYFIDRRPPRPPRLVRLGRKLTRLKRKVIG